MSHNDWTPSPGHVLFATVPYSDVEGNKNRMPIVVSSREFNSKHPEIVVAFATRSSKIKHPRSYDVEVPKGHPDFGLTGLTESTTVRCGRLWTIDKKKVYDCVGCVPNGFLTDILHLVRLCFAE